MVTILRYAIVENNKVTNIVGAKEAMAPNWIRTDTAQIGWDYDGVVFSSPTVQQQPQRVPQSVSRRQARQALFLADLLDDVEPAIAAIPDEIQRKLAEIEWQDSQEFFRDRPLVIQIGAALQLSATQLDKLFIDAAKL